MSLATIVTIRRLVVEDTLRGDIVADTGGAAIGEVLVTIYTHWPLDDYWQARPITLRLMVIITRYGGDIMATTTA